MDFELLLKLGTLPAEQGSADQALAGDFSPEVLSALLSSPELRAQLIASLPPDPRLRTNVVPERIPLIGRRSTLGQIMDLIASGEGVVTLTGPGGMGKSRLAREVVRHVADSMPDGAWVIPCAGLEGRHDITSEIGRAFGALPEADVFQLLRGKRALLVLDGVERVSGAAALVADLALQLPTIRFVVTTRGVLNIPGERVLRLTPLGVRSREALLASIAPEQRRADRLHLARALVGVPLALSVAAASLDADGAAPRIGSTSSIVANALAATSKDEARALEILAAIPVPMSEGLFAELSARLNLDGSILRRLEARRMIEQVPGLEGGVTLHDLVRESVLQRMAPERTELIWRAHAELLGIKAEGLAAEVRQAKWSGLLEVFAPNRAQFRLAIRNARHLGELTAVRTLVYGTIRFAFEAGYYSDLDEIADAGLVAARALDDAEVELRILGTMGAYASVREQNDLCRERWERCLELHRKRNDLVGQVDILTDLARLAGEVGDLEREDELLAESEKIAAVADNPVSEYHTLIYRGHQHFYQGRYEEALAWYDRCPEEKARGPAGNSLFPKEEARCRALLRLGRLDEALEATKHVMSYAVPLLHHRGMNTCLRHRAEIFEARGEVEDAALQLACAYQLVAHHGTSRTLRTRTLLDEFLTRHPHLSPVVESALQKSWSDLVKVVWPGGS